MEANLRGFPAVAAAMAVAAGFRIPSLLSRVYLGYDDGVYGASTALIAAGFTPFQDFFSSQGPVFLPLLRFFDLLGIGGVTAPRLAMGVSAAVIAAAVYIIARTTENRSRALAASLIVASSGSLLLASSRLQSDGPALAFGLLAMAIIVICPQLKPWQPVLAGLLVALALATKSLHLIPTLIAVLAVTFLRGTRLDLGRLLGASLVTGLLVTWPFSLGKFLTPETE